MQCIYIYIIYAWIYNCCPSFNIASSLETLGPTSSAYQPLKDGNSARRHVTYSAWRSWLLALVVCEWLGGHLEETTHMNCLHIYIYTHSNIVINKYIIHNVHMYMKPGPTMMYISVFVYFGTSASCSICPCVLGQGTVTYCQLWCYGFQRLPRNMSFNTRLVKFKII